MFYNFEKKSKLQKAENTGNSSRCYFEKIVFLADLFENCMEKYSPEYEIKHSEYSYFLHKRYLPVIHSYKAGIFYSSKDSYLPSNTEQLAMSFFFFNFFSVS